MKNNFVFFGTPQYAVETLKVLFENGFVPSLVICSPDARVGRKQILTEPPVKVFAQEHGIPVFQPNKIDDEAVQKILEASPEYAVVAAYGKILPNKLLDAVPKGFLNVHPSLLPKYRGPAPLEGPILNGDDETGVSIMLLDALVDHGPILHTEKIKLQGDEFAHALGEFLFKRGGQILTEIIPKWLAGDIKSIDQDHTQATFTKKITKDSAKVDINDDQRALWAKWRAYQPWPGMYFEVEHGNKTIHVKINKATYEQGLFNPITVTPEGRTEISYTDFKKGYL